MSALVQFLAFAVTVVVAHCAAIIWRLGVRVAVEDPTGGDET